LLASRSNVKRYFDQKWTLVHFDPVFRVSRLEPAERDVISRRKFD